MSTDVHDKPSAGSDWKLMEAVTEFVYAVLHGVCSGACKQCVGIAVLDLLQRVPVDKIQRCITLSRKV